MQVAVNFVLGHFRVPFNYSDTAYGRLPGVCFAFTQQKRRKLKV